MGERWEDIAGFEGLYQVSDRGRVRSLDRYMPHARWGTLVFYRGRVLKPTLGSGYPSVSLRRGGKRDHERLVHRLVAHAFVPNPLGLPQVLHKDDNPMNARASNLRWGTHQENMMDKRCPHCRKRLYK